MEQPLVSVVIPAYNDPERLLEAVQSVRRQTYSPLEIIVVDDASPSDTLGPIENLHDGRIQTIRTGANAGGPATPMSLGARAAVGRFVAYLDHDDIAHPHWIETLITILVRDQGAGMTWGNIEVIAANGAVRAIDRFASYYPEKRSDQFPRFLLNNPPTTGLMVRKDVFEEIGYFDPGTGPYADLDFITRFASRGQWSGKSADVATVKRRMHAQNLTKNWSRMYEDQLHFVRKHQDILAAFPALLGHYYLSLSYGAAVLKRNRESRDHLDHAKRLLPSTLKLRLYSWVHATPLFACWQALGETRRALAIQGRRLQSRATPGDHHS